MSTKTLTSALSPVVIGEGRSKSTTYIATKVVGPVKDASGNDVNYSCSSKDKTDFANKVQVHVNNHICKNIYRSNRGCMELTGGYIEEAIAVDINTGRKSCAIYIVTFVDKNLNDPPWQYGGTLFEMPSWC